jgi:hypothetical protein
LGFTFWRLTCLFVQCYKILILKTKQREIPLLTDRPESVDMERIVPLKHEIPPMKDLTADNITDNVVTINNQCSHARGKYIFERLVHHLHDFAREVRLSSEEWMLGIEFLTKVGQISDDLRHEMILLSDTLGLSILVDSIDHPRIDTVTESQRAQYLAHSTRMMHQIRI